MEFLFLNNGISYHILLYAKNERKPIAMWYYWGTKGLWLGFGVVVSIPQLNSILHYRGCIGIITKSLPNKYTYRNTIFALFCCDQE